MNDMTVIKTRKNTGSCEVKLFIVYSIYFQTQNTKYYCMMVQLKIKHKRKFIMSQLFDPTELIVRSI